MKTRILIAFSCAVLLAADASAQTAERESETAVSVRTDLSSKTVSAFERETRYTWRELEVAGEHTFAKDKLWLISGFRVGFRTASLETYHDGVWLSAGLFKRYDVSKNLSLYPALTVLYGAPGSNMSQSWNEWTGPDMLNQTGYTKLYPIRNARIPKTDADVMGMAYPEFSLAARTGWKFVFVEGSGGFKVMRFGSVQSDFVTERSDTETVFIPVAAVRFGLRWRH